MFNCSMLRKAVLHSMGLSNEVKLLTHVHKPSFPNGFAINCLTRETHLPVDVLIGDQQFFDL